MSYRIQFSKQAKNDLSSIYTYISNELSVPETAARITTDIKKSINSLKTFPFRYQRVQDPIILRIIPSNIELRSFNVDGYRVFYYALEKESIIIIARILHGSRDLGNILKESDLNGNWKFAVHNFKLTI